jgi:guanylate kinase
VKPFLLVLSSPSGGGKSTIAKHLLAARDNLQYSVSATTRPPRPGEEDGVAYHFLTLEEFERRDQAGEFVETASYGGHRYGTLRGEVERALTAGRHLVLDIEVVGARQVRQAFPDSVCVFILPPTAAALIDRLQGRDTEDATALETRMTHAADELLAAAEYDYVVVNDDLVAAVDRVAAILDAEYHRVVRLPDLEARVKRIREDVEKHRNRLAGRPA